MPRNRMFIKECREAKSLPDTGLFQTDENSHKLNCVVENERLYCLLRVLNNTCNFHLTFRNKLASFMTLKKKFKVGQNICRQKFAIELKDI